MPTMTAVRFKQREEKFLGYLALKECIEKRYRKIRISD